MGRPSAGIYLAFLIVVLAVEAGLLLGKSVLLIDQHEGDALHVIQIATQMALGQVPHVDFHTPLGVLAFAPISWLMSLGLATGTAIKAGGLLFAVFLLPAVFWAGYSRLSSGLAFAFGAATLILATALVYGGADTVASISMYYNRWGWAVVFTLAVLAVLPARSSSDIADGIVIGLGLAFLGLSKITFFVAVFPAVLVALLIRQSWRTLLIGLASGIVLCALVTLVHGVGFWSAYLGDLRFIMSAPIRSQPGLPLSDLLIAPTHLAATLCLLAAVVFVRQADRTIPGVVLALLAPGFIYATYQSWGNDPKWLLLLVILLIALLPDRMVKNGIGMDVGRAMITTAVVSLALILPSTINLALANLRHARLDRAAFSPLFPLTTDHSVMMRTDRLYLPARREGFAFHDPAIAERIAATNLAPKPDTLFGQPLPLCKLEMGMIGALQQMAADLEALPETQGKSVFIADTFSSLWLFGATRPVPGGQPWYYGGDLGVSTADYILIPLCPVTYTARGLVLKRLAERPDRDLSEVARTDLYVLLRQGPQQ
jgi:hypothetical protein